MEVQLAEPNSKIQMLDCDMSTEFQGVKPQEPIAIDIAPEPRSGLCPQSPL